VCDPRKNSRQGNKNDQIDAREPGRRLYMNKLSSVYHGGAGVRTLKELARSYLTISKDLARVMSRVKAIYRSWGIPCAGKQVYALRHRAEWLAKITEWGCFAGRVLLPTTRCPEAAAPRSRRELLAESKKHPATKLLCQIPSIGPSARAVDRADSDTAPLPHQATVLEIQRLCIEMHSSADYRSVKGQLEELRSKSRFATQRDCNHDLKNLFKK